MKIVTPQILWHSDDQGKAAALTGLDCTSCNSNGGCGIVATSANTDSGDAVHLWSLTPQQKQQQQQTLQFLYALNRHGDDEPVGGVRFAPNVWHLAVAGSGVQGALVVYSVPEVARGGSSWLTGNDIQRSLVAHCGNGITDLDWSRDSRRLAVGTIHHAVFVFERQIQGQTQTQTQWKTIYHSQDSHTHFVQGVALDPLSNYLASQSSDRTIRLWQSRTMPKQQPLLKQQPTHNSNECLMPSQTQTKWEVHPTKKPKQIKFYKPNLNEATVAQSLQQHQQQQQQRHYLFCDESTLNSFVRRLAWTTDGAYLICPAAMSWRMHNDTDSNKNNSNNNCPNNTYATLLFQRHQWDQPYRILSGLETVCFIIYCCAVFLISTITRLMSLLCCVSYSLRLRCVPIPSCLPCLLPTAPTSPLSPGCRTRITCTIPRKIKANRIPPSSHTGASLPCSRGTVSWYTIHATINLWRWLGDCTTRIWSMPLGPRMDTPCWSAVRTDTFRSSSSPQENWEPCTMPAPRTPPCRQQSPFPRQRR